MTHPSRRARSRPAAIIPSIAIALGLALALAGSKPAFAHDIPNARVDRATQIVLGCGVLRVEYEVGLAELTLTRDLRDLIGTLPGGDRATWFKRYGEETAPLNARGFHIRVNGKPVPLELRGFDLFVEEHPRYVFRYEVPLPPSGRLLVHDTNYLSSEGAVRLALRAEEPARITGGDLRPESVDDIPIQLPVLLTDEEEMATRRVEVRYECPEEPASAAAADLPAVAPDVEGVSAPDPIGNAPSATPAPAGPRKLVELLDRASSGYAGLAAMLGVAFLLGLAHAFQPGHGKTLVAATALGPEGGRGPAVALGLSHTVAHVGIVLALALALKFTRVANYESINAALATIAGFAIAMLGVWRLGRHLGGHGEHGSPNPGPGPNSNPDASAALSGPDLRPEPSPRGYRAALGIGFLGGLIPCWDAVLLVILAEALGRFQLGLLLLLQFSLGMAVILVAVALLANGFRARILRAGARTNSRWPLDRMLGAVSGALLAIIGLTLLLANP